MRIITNKWVSLPPFEASPPIVTPINSPFFVDLRPPPNTEYIRHLSRSDLKGGINEKNHHILVATKFEVPLQNFSEVSTGSGCGVTLYLRKTM